MYMKYFNNWRICPERDLSTDGFIQVISWIFHGHHGFIPNGIYPGYFMDITYPNSRIL